MDASISDIRPAGVLLVPGQLYRFAGRTERRLRFICCDIPTDRALFARVDPKWNAMPRPATVMGYRKTLELLDKGKLYSEDECIRPRFMTFSEEQLKAIDPQWVAQRDADVARVSRLVDEVNIFATYCPDTSHRVLAAHAAVLADGTSKQQLSRLVHTYAWFGLDENALLKRHALKGVGPRIGEATGTKRGRPNAAIREGYGARFSGRNVTPRDLRLFEQALREFWIRRDETLEETYRLMVDTYYVQVTKDADGVVRAHPISLLKVPTREEFLKRADLLRRKLGLDRLKAGHADGKALAERKGRHTDIAPNVGDVYDSDGTPFNRELVADFVIRRRTRNIGKPTVILVLDRVSQKVMGWHVYPGTENWREGYRLAWFCAMTSKKDILEWLQIDAPEAWPDGQNIAPGANYFDGGGASSISARKAMDRLRIGYAKAPPETPYWKPLVEAMMGIQQSKQATRAGGYRRTRRARDRKSHRLAKLLAKDTLYEFERVLVENIIEWNAARNKQHLLTHTMKQDGVEPTSDAIFAWGVRRMGGVAHRVGRQEDIYLALLEHDEKPIPVTVDGVRKFRARYQSHTLRSFWEQAQGKLAITTMHNAAYPKRLYWITPDGRLDSLERDARDGLGHGTMTAHEIDLWATLDRAEEIRSREKPRRRRTTVTRRQAQVALRGHEGKQRNAPTPAIDEMRRLQARKTRTDRGLDDPERYVPPSRRTMPIPTGADTGAAKRPKSRVKSADLWAGGGESS